MTTRSEEALLGFLNEWERDNQGEAFGPALDQLRDELPTMLRQFPLRAIRRTHDQYARRKAAILAGHPYLESVSSYSPERRVEREFALLEAYIEAAKTVIALKSRRTEPHQAQELPVPSKNEPFSHSKDYRTVSVGEATYKLTSRQAQFIQILHEAYKDGMPDVSADRILEQLGTQNSRWQDTWRRNAEARTALIRSGDRRGTLRLKL